MKRALVACAAGLVLAGCGGTTTRTVTVASETRTETTTRTVTVTQTQARPAPKPKAGGLHFAGNGSKDLPPFRVAHASTLYWRAKGNYFYVGDRGGDITILSKAAHGQTFVRAGRHQLAVGAVDEWTITIR